MKNILPSYAHWNLFERYRLVVVVFVFRIREVVCLVDFVHVIEEFNIIFWSSAAGGDSTGFSTLNRK